MLHFLLFFEPACSNTEFLQKQGFLRAHFNEALSLVALAGRHLSEILAESGSELPTDGRGQAGSGEQGRSARRPGRGRLKRRGHPSGAGWSEGAGR